MEKDHYYESFSRTRVPALGLSASVRCYSTYIESKVQKVLGSFQDTRVLGTEISKS